VIVVKGIVDRPIWSGAATEASGAKSLDENDKPMSFLAKEHPKNVKISTFDAVDISSPELPMAYIPYIQMKVRARSLLQFIGGQIAEESRDTVRIILAGQDLGGLLLKRARKLVACAHLMLLLTFLGAVRGERYASLFLGFGKGLGRRKLISLFPVRRATHTNQIQLFYETPHAGNEILWQRAICSMMCSTSLTQKTQKKQPDAHPTNLDILSFVLHIPREVAESETAALQLLNLKGIRCIDFCFFGWPFSGVSVILLNAEYCNLTRSISKKISTGLCHRTLSCDCGLEWTLHMVHGTGV
jgi:hypothetical protein